MNVEEIETTPIPVRKTSIPEMWDQYLLYGLQYGKRSRDEVISSGLCEEDKLPFLSLCLSKEELENNNYMIIRDEGSQLGFQYFTSRSSKNIKRRRILVYRAKRKVTTKGNNHRGVIIH